MNAEGPDMRVNYWARVSANGVEPNAHHSEEKRDPMSAQVEMCRAWLRACAEPTKTIRSKTSYALKHAVERWSELAGPHDQIDDWGRAWSGTYFYVSNGAFITAALAEGYRGRRADNGDLNMRFNLRIKKEGR